MTIGKTRLTLFSNKKNQSQNFEMDIESFDLGVSGNFQIEAILEYIDISDSVFTCGTFVLDILTVADGCQLIYNFGNISIITSIYLCI